MAWIVAVYNLPGEFDSFSLREFFDLKDALELFHFKNRPESSLRQLVQKHFPNVTLEGGVEPKTSDDELSKPSCTSSTVTIDFLSMIQDKSQESTASTLCTKPKPTLLVSPPNTKSAFIKVKGERLADFTDRYHRRPWFGRAASPPVSDQCCLVTPLARENDPSTSIPACEEFHPPAALCRGNVGTSNSELVRLVDAGKLLSDAMLSKIQLRAPTLWRWARQPHLPCPHSAEGSDACAHVFAYNIPHHYLKQDIKNFFRESIEAKSVCQLTYIGRPTSVLLQFLQENLPHYQAPVPPGVPFEEGDESPGDLTASPTPHNTVSDRLDLYPFSALCAGTKSCLLRVKSEHLQDFLSRYTGCAWGESTGSCYLVKIKQYDTGRLAFLSELRHGRSRGPGSPYSREGSFLGLFLARLVPDTLRERLRVAQPELADKLRKLEQRAPSVISLPILNDDGSKHTPHPNRPRLQQYAAIPPPRSLQYPRRRRPKPHAPQTSPESFSAENILKDDDLRERNSDASHSAKEQESVDEGSLRRSDRTQPLLNDPVVQKNVIMTKARETESYQGLSLHGEGCSKIAASGIGQRTFKKNSWRGKWKESNHVWKSGTNADAIDPFVQVLLGDAEITYCEDGGSQTNQNQASDGKRLKTEKENAWAERKRGKYGAKPSKRRNNFRAKEVHMDSEGSEDGSDVEEWERSEAFRDTIDEKHSARERLFEEEIELVWEKGGSGLNFYTDEVYWRAQQGDFDERSTDEWDVDMQGYYGGVPGDYDAVCRQDMDRMDRLRAGGDESCFVAPRPQRRKRQRSKTATETFITPCREGPDAARRRMLVNLRTDDEPEPRSKTERRKANKARRQPPSKIGVFEQHTRGIGRRLLEEKGWREGQGLGRDRAGRPHAVPADGRSPWDKKGLGFEEPTPCWVPPKPSSPPPGSPCTLPAPDDNNEKQQEVEENPFGTYKDVPIPKLLQHSLMMTKLFEKDFNALLKGEDSDYGEDIVLVIRKMDIRRRKALKAHINTLKEVVSDKQAKRVRLLKEYFVKAEAESSSSSDDGESGSVQEVEEVVGLRAEENGEGGFLKDDQESEPQRKDNETKDKIILAEHLQVLRGYGSDEDLEH